MIGEDPAITPAMTLAAPAGELHRSLDWKGAFWASSGVPAGVLLTMGGIAATIGQPSWVVWIASILMGFIQSFVYAEIAGLYPHKSGGASVYGAAAWLPYSRFVAPISIWANWLAWSPVLTLATSLAAGYIMASLFAPDAAIMAWQIKLVDLGFVRPGLSLRINAVSLIATAFLLLTFALQHGGAARAAQAQKILGLVCLAPLILVGLIPVFTGNLPREHLFPLLPMLRDAAGHAGFGSWNGYGLVLLMGAMFGAGWSTYGFETAVCYTREFRNPARDTPRAIIASGVLCILVFALVPLAFQASLGLDTMLSPSIYDGSGVAQALASIVVKGLGLVASSHAGVLIANLFIAMLILSLLLIVMTSMMGSSRTLYQASLDGWLPRYLSRVNSHGAPTAAMWTDLGFNLILLLASDYFAVLMISNVCYLAFNFLNLQAGWIHRIDRGDKERPFRCPTWLLALGCTFGFVNMAFMGAGADVWGAGTLRNGLIALLLIVPVFAWRHYGQDKGVFPHALVEDYARNTDGTMTRRAGWLPWLALVGCAALIAVTHAFALHHGAPTAG
ncbi:MULTISPECIES: APC family permease [unclassified Novosphingobium]|uniref:APC family permease n=1 Tax=unclassified Novosphingobium TaxID=2644732 RepID=UPI001494D4F3|nr:MULTISPECIES: APC family permease [unclassified Novosphingobium]MBB3359895.1 amino acid transporter [Novosphingobium sp. BK256]MBB3376254.1 amino acid transporter [Novosphingobium sp. BK280]MBB3380668.1 amino acid transporter [Novosphingobium sp. BK258]MBB3422336.1 amino acid transporter [Novosphingobium sp. BK267]MBB3451036.1 amino acid transporter [Novosphingobium sp. BK352]